MSKERRARILDDATVEEGVPLRGDQLTGAVK